MVALVSDVVRRNRSILSYGLVVMTASHTLTHVFTWVHTALFPILQDEFSLSLQQLGLIAAIPPLCQTILSIPTGLLSDKLGCRLMLVISMVIATLGAILASQAGTPAVLIVAVSLIYINTTIYHPAAYSFVTRLFDPKNRLKALGLHGAGGTLGVALGPISISILIGIFALGWREVYLFWVIPLLLGIVAMLFVRSAPEDDAPSDPSAGPVAPQVTSLFSTSLVLFLIYIGVRMMATSMSQSFMALYLVDDRGMSESFASFVIGASTLVGILAAPVGGFVAGRYGEKRWLLTVLTLAYASFGLAILIPNQAAFVILYLAYGFLNYLGMAANSAIMARLSPGKRRGLAYALFFLPSSIMGALAPVMAASIADTFSLASIFYVSTAVFFLSLVVLKVGVRVEYATG